MRKRLKNKAFILLTLAAIAASVFMSGCSRQNANTGSSSIESSTQAVTFTDALGRSVTVRSADRVASLLGSFSEVWTLAGGKLVASVDDAWNSFDLGLPDDAVKLGAILEPNTELLIASRPDFVIASSNQVLFRSVTGILIRSLRQDLQKKIRDLRMTARQAI